MEYTILIHQSGDGGFWSEVPALPGCYSEGDTIEETLRNTKKAIESHIAASKSSRIGIVLKEDFIIGKVRVEEAAALIS